MQVKASWNNGKIELDQPLHLHRKHARLLITVLDEDNRPEQNTHEQQGDNQTNELIPPYLRARVDAELRKYRAIRKAVPEDGEQEELTPEQKQRWAAAEFRRKWREEQGRPS